MTVLESANFSTAVVSVFLENNFSIYFTSNLLLNWGLFSFMFTDFLLKTISRTLKIILSYLSWQSHEKLINPVLSTLLAVALFTLVLSLVL